MKAKHLLFSSVFLSMGFAACTNEVEEFATQTPNFEGVELSEDFTISVKNSDFAASAETRAILNKVEKKWIAEWEENDAVGAAWFDKVALAEDGTVTNSVSVYNALGEYGSNAEFKWMGDAIFKSEAVSKAGAYVLYYPYNEDLTDNFFDIPVKEIKSPQPFNCADVDAQVSENIFAANVVEFEKGQRNQAPVFTIEQIPNLYAISFFIDDEALLKLDKEMEITQIMLEVTNGDAAAINTNGKIYPNIDNNNDGVLDYTIPAADYNADKMPAIGFEGDVATRISRMIINVTNTEKDSKYYITDLGKDNGTDRFYFSMLPTAAFDKVTFKIIGKIDGKTKVFARTYTASGTGLPTAYSAFATLQTLMTGNGQVVELPVKLNYEDSTEDGIYSEDQFVENWKAGETSFNLQVPMDLSAYAEQVNFILGEDAEPVTFKGMPVTLPSISGNYTFESDVKVNGDANLVGGTVNGNIEVTGNLTADGVKFNAPVVVGDGTKGTGNFISKSAVTFKKASSIKGNVTVENGTLSVPSKTVIGGSVTVKAGTLKATGTTITKNLTINKDAIAELKGTWSVSAVTVKGSLVNQGKATINGKVTVYNTGVLNIADKSSYSLEKLGSLVVNEGAEPIVIYAKVVEAGAITANAPVTFNNTVGTVGDVTANAAVTFINTVGTVGYIDANADVTFNADIENAGNINATTGKVQFAGVTGEAGNITAEKDVTFTGAVNCVGNIGTAEKHATGKITFNETVTKAGDIFAAADVEFKKDATTGAINTTAPVTFGGNATVVGNITANNVAVTFAAKANLMKDVAEGDDEYFDVNLTNEASLKAAELIAKDINVNDQYSTLTVTNKLDVKGTLTANGKVIAPVQEASTINTLTIKPGITVDMSEAAVAATINNLTTETKGEYVGLLKGNTSIGNGENKGKIEGKTTITGTFKQSGDLVGDVTVNNGATFTVAANLNNTISNNGTVIVDNDITVKAITNNTDAVLNLNGTASVRNNKATSVVRVSETGKLTLSYNNAGTIYVKNYSTFNVNGKNPGNVAYVWDALSGKPVNGTEANQIILDYITQIDMKNATVEKATDITDIATINTINVEGNWTLPAGSLNLSTIANGINVNGDATFTSEGTCKFTANVNVAAEKVLTIDDAHVQFQPTSTIKLGLNASLKGDKKGATLN